MDGHSTREPKVALVWRGDPAAPAEFGRFAGVAEALAAAGLRAEACLYDEGAEAVFRDRLMACDAALVWVNPIQDGRRRGGLNAILRAAAVAGVRVSAHPDVIERMGVKAVLARTSELGWSGDARFYATSDVFAAEFPAQVAAGPRVLKQNRGNGGIGVWKVTDLGGGQAEIQEAAGEGSRVVRLDGFLAERIADFTESGGFVDQAWQPRLPEGMVRCYMSGDRLAGFGWHLVRMLAPPDAGPGGPRTYSGPTDPRFQRLREGMEREWTPALCRILGIAPDDLPVIWDADFLLGPRDAEGRDTYVLCEINASCVFPIPAEAPQEMARTLMARLAVRRPSRRIG